MVEPIEVLFFLHCLFGVTVFGKIVLEPMEVLLAGAHRGACSYFSCRPKKGQFFEKLIGAHRGAPSQDPFG